MGLKYSDGDMITNEDLVACYPRRIKKIKSYEVWQFPYVNNEVLYNEDDIVGISFGNGINKIYIISMFKDRLEDLDFINRVISLVHDISDEFEIEKQLVETELSIEEILKMIKE